MRDRSGLFAKEAGAATTADDHAAAYRADIDGLRAVAVAAVIAHHLDRDVLPGGYLGVDVFFVISGYVISAALLRLPNQSAQAFLLSFYQRRMRRLLPALIGCVLGTALAGSVFIPPSSELSNALSTGIYALFGLSNIHLYRQALDYFGISADLNLFTHTWSLGVEEQFYLVYPLLCWVAVVGRKRVAAEAGRRMLILVLCGLVVASLALFAWHLKTAPQAAYYLMPWRFWELGAGCLAFHLHRPHLRSPGVSVVRPGLAETRPGLAATRAEALTVVAALGLGVALCLPVAWQAFSTLLAVTATTLLLVVEVPGAALHRLLTAAPVVHIGLVSYSLYLWHWSVIALSRWTIGLSWRTVPVLLVLMLALAELSYWLLERPLRRRPWARSDGRTIGIGVAALALAWLLVFAVHKPLKGVLYAGTPPALALRGVETLMADKLRDGKLIWNPETCVLADNAQVGKAIDWERCRVTPPDGPLGRNVLVVGNSLSAAEFEMYQVLVDKRLGNVVVTSAWGASPVADIPNTGKWAAANDHYWEVVVPKLMQRLGAGDVLLIVADVSDLTPAVQDSATRTKLAQLHGGLDRLASTLAAKGGAVLFQSANPFLREAGCTPEMAKRQWFHAAEPVLCRYLGRAETLLRMAPLTSELARLRAAHRNFHVLDLLPVLCPGASCRYTADGGESYLYRDGYAHLSVEANLLAQPVLEHAAREAMASVSAPR